MKLRKDKEAADKARADKLLAAQKAGPYVSPETAQLLALHEKLRNQVSDATAQLRLLAAESSGHVDAVEAKLMERGGDIDYLKLSVPTGQEKAHLHPVVAVPTATQIKVAENLLKEERRQARVTGTKDYSFITDADVFSATRNLKPVESAHGVSSAAEQAFMHCWASLPTDADDGYVRLDLDIVHDLFEYCGLFLTDFEAQMCLDQTPTNQLGRKHHRDILKWYRQYVSAASKAMPAKNLPLYRLPLWRRLTRASRQWVDGLLGFYHGLWDGLAKQKQAVDLVADVKAKMEELLKPPDDEDDKESKDGALDDFINSGSVATGSPGKHGHHVNTELHGNMRLAAWQRQQLFKPDPTVIDVQAAFDPRVEPVWSPYESEYKRSRSPAKGSRAGTPGKGSAPGSRGRSGSPGKAAGGAAAGAPGSASEARKSPSQRAKEKLKAQQDEEAAMLRGQICFDCFVFPKELMMGNREDDRVANFAADGTKAGILGGSAVTKTTAEALKASVEADDPGPPGAGAAAAAPTRPPNPNAPRATANDFFSDDKFGVDDNNRILYGVSAMRPVDVLPHFQKLHFKALGEKNISNLSNMVKDELYGSCAYFVVNCAEGIAFEQAQLLMVTLVDLFESIPYDDRKDVYTKAVADVYKYPVEVKKEAKDQFAIKAVAKTPTGSPNKSAPGTPKTPGSAGSGAHVEWTDEPAAPPPPPPRYVVLVGLVHEKDWFKDLEDGLPPGVLITRGLRDASAKLMINHTLRELYDAALPFEHFEERLYGPQEDEIGEEAMNPLRFAKSVRQRQTAIKKDMEVVQDLGYSKIKELLRARGLTDAGDRAECLRRYLKLRERDLDAITSGSDLSYFGKELVGRVFSMVKNAAPKIVNYIRTQAPDDPLQAKKLAIAKMKGEALPPPDTDMIHAENADSFLLWDMNRLLTGTEAWGTLFDGTEYRRFLTEMELLQDRKGLLTREGLHAYYEVCGRLKDDIRGLGIGSLNETVAGKIKMSAAYEPECVSTLLPLAECGHTLSQQLWKRVIAAVSSLFEVSADSDFQSMEHALDMFFHILTALGVPLHGVDRDVKAGIREPGWVARKLHEVSAWLADGREGVIRSLRKTALADHGRFDQFHHIFTHFFENELLGHASSPVKAGGGDKADFVSVDIKDNPGALGSDGDSISSSLASFQAKIRDAGVARPDATPPKEESLPPPPEMNDEEIAELRAKIRDMLAPLEDSKGLLRDIKYNAEQADRLDRILAGKVRYYPLI